MNQPTAQVRHPRKGSGAVQSPYTYHSGYDNDGLELWAEFYFDNTTRVVSGGLCHRDPGCHWNAVLLGDPNGSPTRIPAAGAIPDGDTPLSQAEINAYGFATAEDLIAVQITAVP